MKTTKRFIPVDMKKTRIKSGDKELNNEYIKEQFKLKAKKFFKKIMKLGTLIGIIIVVANIIAYTNPKIKTIIETKTVTIDNLQDKIIELQNEIITTIKSCESKGHSEEDALIVFDSNKKPSIGQFQFQTATVQYYYKKLYNHQITPKEAVLIALDTKKAESLAMDIIFKGQNKANDWYNCSKKFEIDSKLDIINKLQK